MIPPPRAMRLAVATLPYKRRREIRPAGNSLPSAISALGTLRQRCACANFTAQSSLERPHRDLPFAGGEFVAGGRCGSEGALLA